MKIELVWAGKNYEADLAEPIDISLVLKAGLETVNCFYAPPMEIWPVKAGDFVGATLEGGPVNFMNVKFNPHGNGTHTECVGHIAKEPYSINKCLTKFVFIAELISVYPERRGEDRVITKRVLEEFLEFEDTPALIIRTMPNDKLKQTTNYSGGNPPYLEKEAVDFLVSKNVKHLLIDTPSIDREEDEGAVVGHKTFWTYPEAPREDCTITELIFVSNNVPDGLYLLNIQIASFDLDVSPSKPVLYSLKNR